MLRPVLDEELTEVTAKVEQLGILVERALALAVEALEALDVQKASATVAADCAIDSLHLEIEEYTHKVVLMQQPLGGFDLRYLTSIPPISIDLERIGDEAVNIALAIERLQAYPSPDGLYPDERTLLETLVKLGQQVQSTLQGTMKAFRERDTKAARQFWFEHTIADRYGFLVRRDSMDALEYKRVLPALAVSPHVLQRIVHLLWVAYHLERASDHCTNICERIVYFVENEYDINKVVDE